MSGRGRRGRPRKVIPAVPDRPVVPVRDEHVVGSTTASMNQPLAVGLKNLKAKNSRGIQTLFLFL